MSLTKKQKTLLEAIVAKTQADTIEYYSTKVVQALIDAGFVEQNPSMANEQGELATRATQQGIDAMSDVQNQQAATPVAKPTFAIVAVPMPTAKRGGRTGETYPFDKLEVGQSFFVPNDAVKSGDAAKSLASTVTTANERFSEVDPNGATRTNRKGNVVPVRTQQRKFEMRAMQDGAPWGGEFAGKAGAGIWRTL
jgi:hypothetical protein